MDEHLREIGVSRETVYQGRIFTVLHEKVRLPDGSIADRDRVEHSGGVGVIPITDKGTVFMVRQYRRPHDAVLLEIPAGKKNPGEDPLTCGIRELEEETGMKAKEFRHLATLLPTPAYCSEVIEVYLATGLYPGEKHLDEDEFLDVLEIPLSELVKMVMNNEIIDSKTQIAILKANELLK